MGEVPCVGGFEGATVTVHVELGSYISPQKNECTQTFHPPHPTMPLSISFDRFGGNIRARYSMYFASEGSKRRLFLFLYTRNSSHNHFFSCRLTCRDNYRQLCVYVFFPFILDIKFVGRTNRGHTGGRSRRIFHPPSFCGACLNFSREKDSIIHFPR